MTINEAHGAELKSLNELATEGRKRRQEQGQESHTGTSGGDISYRFPPLAASPRQEQDQRQPQHPFFSEGVGGGEPNYSSGGGGGVEEEGAGGGRGVSEHEEFGEHHHAHHVRHQRQPHQHRDDTPSHGDHQGQHQGQHQDQQVGNTPEQRSGRREGGMLKAHFADAGGGRPRSEGAVSGVQPPPQGRAPVDGGGEADAHWEASKGIGTLRRGKSAGTFFLQQQQQQEQQHQRHQHLSRDSARHDGGGCAGITDGTAGAPGEKNHQTGNAGGRHSPAREDAFDSHPGRAPGDRRHRDDDTHATGSRHHGEDQRTVSDLTSATSLTQRLLGGTIPPLSERRQGDLGEMRGITGEESRHPNEGTSGLRSSQRQESGQSPRAGGGRGGGASVSAYNGLNTPPQDLSGQPTGTVNGEGAEAGLTGGQSASPTVPANADPPSPEVRNGASVTEGGNNNKRHGTTESPGAVTAATTRAPAQQAPAAAPSSAPAASMKELQARGYIQHTPKTVSDVVLAAAGGNGTESPQASQKSGKASEGGSAKAVDPVGDEGRCHAKDGAEAPTAVAPPEETAVGGESDGDAEDSKHQRQQRALKAFLQGVSEGCRSVISVPWQEQMRHRPRGFTPFTRCAEFIRASTTSTVAKKRATHPPPSAATRSASSYGWRSIFLRFRPALSSACVSLVAPLPVVPPSFPLRRTKPKPTLPS